MPKFKQTKVKDGEIHFRPISPVPFFSEAQPTPAVKHVPEWYKNIPRNVTVTEEQKKEDPKYFSVSKGTVKRCVPVLDALTAGYVYSSPIEVAFDEQSMTFGHISDLQFITGHDGAQLDGFAASGDYLPVAFKWTNLNIITTPPGWSCLFTHPLNRLDLPFTTLSGVVDTDTHPMPVNFPFLMKRGFSGKIPLGTPLVQIIPFKREEWKSVTQEYMANDSAVLNATKLTEDNYKKSFWHRKSFN